MQNLKLTIQEAQEVLLMSQSSVYSWIDKGKLQTIEGPSGKVIVITSTEANQIRELNLKSKRNKTSKQSTTFVETPSQASNNFRENIGKDSEIHTAQTPQELTNRLITELRELAFEAGKYKQLEIIRNEEKENVKYWEEKFFEANHALNEKNFEITALKTQITALETEIENLKKPWYKRRY